MRHRPRRPLTLRRTAAAAIAMPVALALASCGNDGDSPAAQDEPSASASPTGDALAGPEPDEEPLTDGAKADETSGDAAGSGRTAVGATAAGDTITPAEFGDLLDAAFEKATTAKVTMANDSAQMAASSKGVVDFTGDSPRLQLQMTGGPLPEGTTADIRLLDDGLYMDTGFSGGKFVKVPADQIAATGLDLSDIDPSKAARTFAEAASEVTYVGTEKVAGESLHRYTLKLDPARLELPARARGKVPKDIGYDAWFDRDGLLRKVTTTLGKVGSTTVTYADWGAPVTISKPPAADIMEMPTLPKSRQG